jgi:hypothetical protein
MSYAYDNVHTLGASGGYGGIPDSEYMRKIEKTNYYENPNQLEDHIRKTLTDWKPDAPFLESDQIRSSDDRGGGFQSESRLNLRHGGARTLDDPWLPDGTFLEHIGGMTDRDPRGNAIGPDMREHVKQQYARRDLINFYDDSDYSVPESGINPEQMRDNVRGMQAKFKDRYQNFDTSKDSWHNGGTGISKRTGGSDVAKYTTDGTIMDMVDATQGNRSDATTLLSNDPKVGFRHTTPDHRVKVAKYGHVRTNQFLHDNDWSNNRMSSFLDHNQMAVIDGTMVNKMLAHLIVDLEGSRQTKQVVAQGIDYNNSHNTIVRSAKLSPQDVYKIMMIDMSSPDNANTRYDGKIMMRKLGNTKHDNRNLLEQTNFNHEVAASMIQATRKARDYKDDNLRSLMDSVEASTKHSGTYRESANRNMLSKTTRNIGREGLDTRYIENSRETMRYGSIKPSKTNRINHMIDITNFGDTSINSMIRTANHTDKKSNSVDSNEYDIDQGRLDFGTYDRADRANHHEHMGRDHTSMMDIGDGEFGNTVSETDLLDLM